MKHVNYKIGFFTLPHNTYHHQIETYMFLPVVGVVTVPLDMALKFP
jgi:hypothetical protein